jgi:hypothetical protein
MAISAKRIRAVFCGPRSSKNRETRKDLLRVEAHLRREYNRGTIVCLYTVLGQAGPELEGSSGVCYCPAFEST